MRGILSKALLAGLSPITYSINGNIKGIVLDLENKEFNMLRNCEDLNIFLKEKKISEINCDSDKFTIGDLRIVIDEINKPYR
jgi:hypothetical protein